MDLKQAIEEAQAEGKRLIVMGDWNSRMKDVNVFFSEVGMEEAIREQHNLTLPITCNRSHSNPIDGIYTSLTIVGVSESYLAFGKLRGDHRGLLLNILDEYILGFTMQDLVPPSVRHLKMDNPAVVKKYNNTL